jgi:hypothetical protein
MQATPKYEGKCISPNGGHSEGVFLLCGRQPLRFRRLVGLMRSRSYRARSSVSGLCLGHAAPGPAPCFGVNGSRGRGIKNRSVFHIHIWEAVTKCPRGQSTKGLLKMSATAAVTVVEPKEKSQNPGAKAKR